MAKEPWKYVGEKIDREKMDQLKDELENYVYDNNADKIIFGEGSFQEPNYKIFIPEEDWNRLLEEYPETDFWASKNKNKYIKIALSDIIEKYKISVPFKKIPEEEAKKDFIRLAQDPELFSQMSTRHRYLKDKKRWANNEWYSLELFRIYNFYFRPGDDYEDESTKNVFSTRLNKKEAKLVENKILEKNPDTDKDVLNSFENKSWYIKKSDVGRSASNHFFQDVRLGIGSRHSQSRDGFAPDAYYIWNNPKMRKYLFEPFWTVDEGMTYVDTRQLKNAFNKKFYVAKQFPPMVAKTMYRLFDAKNVYDPCMGWGDRLTAFLACPQTEFYLGTDPNKKLHPIYDDLLKLYGRALENAYHKRKKVEHYAIPAEDIDDEKYKNTIDLVFTSPPYFDTEKYSDDEEQSFIKFKTLDNWQEGFLYPMIEKSWKMLKDKGILALNIADQYLGKDKGLITYNKYCSSMNKFISTRPGASYVGCLGIEFSQQMGQGVNQAPKGTKNGEPIFIWGKNVSGKTLTEYIYEKGDDVLFDDEKYETKSKRVVNKKKKKKSKRVQEILDGLKNNEK